MNMFCEELIKFVSLVPTNAEADDYVDMAKSTESVMLHWGCTVCPPDAGFPVDACAVAVSHVHETAYRAYIAVCAHPVLGTFRPDKKPLFFEKGLSIAMSVGVMQHKSFCVGLDATALDIWRARTSQPEMASWLQAVY